MSACKEHSGLSERIDRLAEDVSEIKGDVKGLVLARVSEGGIRTLGRSVAVGIGAATPLAALLWALWRR
jgi:hypothetical protein